jgi:DNA mismatch repair protein MutL
MLILAVGIMLALILHWNVEIKAPEEEDTNTGTQLRYDFSASSAKASSKPASASSVSHKLGNSQQGDPATANKLLQILSEFKPDIEALKETPDEPQAVKEQTAEEVVAFSSKPENDAPAIIEDVSENRTLTDIDRLAAADFVGIIFSTYIILQNEDVCFIVDQHAAHERVLYEEFMVKKKPGVAPAVEQVLSPQILTLSWEDYSFVEDKIDRFKENGFELELLGDRQIAVRTVPLGKAGKQSEVFSAILTDLKREVPSKSEIWYQLIQTTACKAAIRAGDKITQQEAMALIEKLSKLEDPYHCAHGRPTFFTVSKKDYEKNFKRIV